MEELGERVYQACRVPRSRKELVGELDENQVDVVRSLSELTKEGRIEEIDDGSGETRYQARLGGDLAERLKTGGWTT